jgi:hypothetical protein
MDIYKLIKETKYIDYTAKKVLSSAHNINFDDTSDMIPISGPLTGKMSSVYGLRWSLSDETKKKMSLNNVGFSGRHHSEETKNELSNLFTGSKNPFYGKKHPQETRIKMGEMSKVKVECPHCKKVGGKSGMHRWHFDNCKYG